MDRFDDALDGQPPREVGATVETSDLLERLEVLETENEELKKTLRKADARRKLRRVLDHHGVSTGELRKAEWLALLGRLPESGELSESWIAEQVSSLALPCRR